MRPGFPRPAYALSESGYSVATVNALADGAIRLSAAELVPFAGEIALAALGKSQELSRYWQGGPRSSSSPASLPPNTPALASG